MLMPDDAGDGELKVSNDVEFQILEAVADVPQVWKWDSIKWG